MEGSAPEITELGGIHDLHKHAANGDTQMVMSILSNNGSENLLHVEGPRKNTPLHLAILYRHKDTAKALVEMGASLTILNACGDMPISYFCDGEMLKTLLSCPYNTFLHNQEHMEANASGKTPNMNIGAVDATGKSILHYASMHLRKTKSRHLFSQLIFLACSEHLLLRDKDGATFLETAAKEGNKTAILALKWSIDAIDTKTQEALINGEVGMTTLMHGQRDFFDKLVALSKVSPAKVKITLDDLLQKLNKVALQKLKDDTRKLEKEETTNVTMNIDSMEKELKKPGSMEQELDMPGSMVNIDSMEQELGMLGGPNVLPTYLALYAEKDEVFKFLLESGLLTENQRDEEYKRTCLHWAVVHKRADIVEKLVKFPHLRPSPSIKDAKGRTALQIAFEDNNQEALELLRGRPPFKESEDKLFRDREVYVQVLNAILVGAALIGSVTFAGWLQLPSQTAFQKAEMKVFWVSNGVSFYSAVAAMCVAIAALLPTPTKYVGRIVKQLRTELLVAALFLTLSLASVAMAFAGAGFAATAAASAPESDCPDDIYSHSHTSPNPQNCRKLYHNLMLGSTIPGALFVAATLVAIMYRLLVDVLPADNMRRLFAGDETEDPSRSTYVNTDIEMHFPNDLVKEFVMRYSKDLVSLHESSSETMLSERREALKSLGFHVNRTTSSLLSSPERRITETDCHHVGPSRNT